MDAEKNISWLHLSDIHVGMTNQGWLWPLLKHEFFSDIRDLYNAEGAWDFVVFSGDLTQRGTAEEYQKLNGVLKELWAVFKSLGFNPSLFPVPGNHDLVRRSAIHAESMVLDEWWSKPIIQSAFWEAGSAYREVVNQNFENYIVWCSKLKEVGIDILAGETGVISGDSSAVFEKNGISIGLIGLNSAWLQITSREYFGSLHVDARQILSVTSDDPVGWCKLNDFNLLVTHHPIKWLHSNSEKLFDELINPPGRFTAHLFGHMHEPRHQKISVGGTEDKREIQAASLFGLEHIEGRGLERIHGYSLNKISVASGSSSICYWPRKDRLVVGGKRIVGADPQFQYQYISDYIGGPISPESSVSTTDTSVFSDRSVVLGDIGGNNSSALDVIKFNIEPAPAHMDVRKVQVSDALSSLISDRCCWIISKWGMGEQGFLWTLRSKLVLEMPEFFMLDLSSYRDLLSFQQDLIRDSGVSLESISASLVDVANPFLILDDVPVGADWSTEKTKEILDLVKILLDFCPRLKIIINAKVSPDRNRFKIIELKPLDLPDLKSYILSHPNGGAKYASYDAVTRIYRHTDGAPNTIDFVLKNLQVTGLSSLSSNSSDVAGKLAISNDGGEALKSTLKELSCSPDPLLQKSYDLLKALTIFPQGEQLNRIKYFNHKQPFFPSYVHELVSRGLIVSVESETIGGLSSADNANTLIVNRVVREEMIGILNAVQFKELNRKAAILYFGDKWNSGVFKSPRWLKFDRVGRSPSELANAAVIIQRLVVDSIESEDKKKINDAMELVTFHGNALRSGSYYRAAVEFFQDVLPSVIDCASERQLAFINSLHARCLRMLEGREYIEAAEEILVKIPLELLDRHEQQSVVLCQGLCHQSLGNFEDATVAAQKAIKIDAKSHAAIQARWIVITNDTENPLRTKNLKDLEVLSKKKKVNVVYNSIALARAAEHSDNEQKKALYEEVVKMSGDDGDTYTATRALIALGEIPNQTPTLSEKSRLIQAYHYLYSGGFVDMFTRCHKILWKIFSAEGDVENLLQLFKYSSLVWRLRGRESDEAAALSDLKSFISKLSTEFSSSNQVMAYYVVRISSVND